MRQYQIFILAAGYNRQTERSCSLWSFSNGKSILDWQMRAFQQVLPESQVRIVVGYDYEKILASYPQLNFSHVLNWESGNALQSFLEARHDLSSPIIAMYGDTIFHPETIAQFEGVDADVVVAVDSTWKKRFHGRSQEDISIAEALSLKPYDEVEYTGLIKLSPRVMEWVLHQKATNYLSKTFVDLIYDIQNAGFQVATYDVAGCWAEMNEPNDLVHFILGNKAETLRRIQHQLKKSMICDQFTCTWQDWSSASVRVLNAVTNQYRGERLIVRSSTIEEDSWETANAGVFVSVLDIDCDDTEAVRKAISDVFASYGRPSAHAQVLIQPFISDIALSGVIFTTDLVTGAPYYVINYDDASGRTDTVTSGQQSELRTVVVFRHGIETVRRIDPRLEVVIEAAQELETVLGFNKLDIEFAIDQNGQVYTFQVRPIVVKHDAYQLDDKHLISFLCSARQHFQRWQKTVPQLVGEYTLFSGMTDWNPAEIIGNRPNTLASSLYRYLITDEVWARQRAEFGYRDVRPAPLVHNFCAQPYVDCRVSINSFIPHDLPDDVAERLVNVYLDILRDDPHLHDKIELDVVFTIWVPTFWEDAKARFKNRNVSTQDLTLLEGALKILTARALERLDEDISSIESLSKRFEQVVRSDLGAIEKVYQLIDDCRRYGTLAFSHAARAGFVAVVLLKSLVKQGILSQERMLAFQANVPTVTGDLQDALADDGMCIDALIKKYGHLRPGTYDVNQTAYWEDTGFYFKRQKLRSSGQTDSNRFEFTKQEMKGLQDILDALPTDIGANELINYISQAIQAREKTKFEFSRNLSKALDLLIIYGTHDLGLAREEVGYLTFNDISALRTGQLDEKLIPTLVKLRKIDVKEKQLVKLPGFIRSEDDFFGFEQGKSLANYITQLSVVAELVFIACKQNESLDSKVVAIPNADPGFDWLFSHKIAGLITQYGGANSHMAIRCAELGIPAAIGVGDKVYESLKEGCVMLDCLKERLEYV